MMTSSDRHFLSARKSRPTPGQSQWAAAQVAAVCRPLQSERAAPEPFAHGVQRDWWPCSDRFTGTAEALMAAGLVRLDQLPGQPGNGKSRCTFDASGNRIRQGSSSSAFTPGRITVERISTNRFRVRVNVSAEEQLRRRAARTIQRDLQHEAVQPEESEARLVPPQCTQRKPISRKTVECLTRLLAEATRGELTGFAYAAMYESRNYHVNAVGEAYSDPISARGMAMQLSDYLGRVARGDDEEEDDE